MLVLALLALALQPSFAELARATEPYGATSSSFWSSEEPYGPAQSPREQAELLDQQAQEQRKLGRFAQAVELHRQALDLQPESRTIRNELARSLLADSSAGEVVDLLVASLKDAETVKLYATACLEINKAAKAIPHLQAYAAQDRDGSIHLLLGKAYQQMHQPTPAGLAMRKAEQLRSAAAASKPN